MGTMSPVMRDAVLKMETCVQLDEIPTPALSLRNGRNGSHCAVPQEFSQP